MDLNIWINTRLFNDGFNIEKWLDKVWTVRDGVVNGEASFFMSWEVCLLCVKPGPI